MLERGWAGALDVLGIKPYGGETKGWSTNITGQQLGPAPQYAASAESGFPIVPVAVGVGALALLFILKKKK